MAVFDKNDIVDIELETGNIHRSFCCHAIGMSDNMADWFGIRVFRNGNPVDLTGASVQGFFKNPHGENIAITSGNFVGDNVAKVCLPQICYQYNGQFVLAIKIVVSIQKNEVFRRNVMEKIQPVRGGTKTRNIG